MPRAFSRTTHGRRRSSQPGYALLALLAAIGVSLVLLASALPAVQHEGQREQEEEFFWRARQVAIAIGSYKASTGNYPLKLEELTKPPEVIGKPKFRLRSSASIDPLTNSEWAAVRLGDPRLAKYIQTVQLYLVQEQKLFPQELLSLAPRAVLLPGQEAAAAEEKETAADDLSPFTDQGPIVGVVSRSKKKLIRNYYTLDTYDRALILTAFCAPLKDGYDCRVLRLPDTDKQPGWPLGEQPTGGAPPRPQLAPPQPTRP